MDLFRFLHESVVLRDTPQGQLIHEVNFVGFSQPAIAKALDGNGEGRREERHLSIPGHMLSNNLLDNLGELGGQKLVSLIHDKHPTLPQLTNALIRHIQHTTRGRHKHMHGLIKAHDIILERRAARRNHDGKAFNMSAQFLTHLGGLQGKLSGGDEDECGGDVLLEIDALENWDEIGACFSGAVLGAGEDVAAGEGDWDGGFLDRGRMLEPHLVDAHEQVALEIVVLELVALGGGYVGRLDAGVARRGAHHGAPVLRDGGHLGDLGGALGLVMCEGWKGR